MSPARAEATNPFRKPSTQPPRDDWEDWEDDELAEMRGPSVSDRGLLVDSQDNTAFNPAEANLSQGGKWPPQQRSSIQKPVSRTKSKVRQRAKIEKAGIKLDTNVSNLRRPAKPATTKSTESTQAGETAGKFMDLAALKALEGSPNSASIGSFSWLKRKPGNSRSRSLKKSVLRPESDLSPEDKKIVIGIAVQENELSEHQVSPQTAVIETPLNLQYYAQRPGPQPNVSSATTPQQLRSVWSPDTEATESPYSGRVASSIYSQPSFYGGRVGSSNVPPVPVLPATFKFQQSQGSALAEPDDDDVGTPCTLFEEDGSPEVSRKSFRTRAVAVSPESAGSRSQGWWDHVTTPFTQPTTPFKQFSPLVDTSSSSAVTPQDWWQDVDEKKQPPQQQTRFQSPGRGIATAFPLTQENTAEPYQSIASSSRTNTPVRQESHSEKARILLEENIAPSEEPPPYSPPKLVDRVKYGPIFPPPPNAVISSQPIPSPGPVSPGIPGTMTSQGAISMTDISLTPRMIPAAVLPNRPVGTYVTQDHFHGAPTGERHRAERQRRRHEKEEYAVRKVGGLWRGRGCIPSGGCFGRTGREGRKRRRVCLSILGGTFAVVILVIVLATVLARKAVSSAQVDSVWLNLTSFPPMPTGVLTVSGPENTENVAGCLNLNANTLWSCSIPKDQQLTDAAFQADQPEFIFQIQFDNSTRALWNISSSIEQPNQADVSTRSARSLITDATDLPRRAVVYDTGFNPTPAAPDVAEIFFLGNTTDGIFSDNKAGEPTPFYISMLSSINATVGPNLVARQGIAPEPANGTLVSSLANILTPPKLNADGTGGPAQMYPLPLQQPVRLFDRGLPTEHYGFYTYFNKTIYVFNRDAVTNIDEDGGASIKDATSLITWMQTRFLVQIWTRMDNSTKLLGNGTTPGTDGTTVHALPGTMPYPVTITEDLHGGNKNGKTVFYYGVEDNQHINTTDFKVISVNKAFGGTIINPLNDADPTLGGIDGGSGGCKCGWQNFVQRHG